MPKEIIEDLCPTCGVRFADRCATCRAGKIPPQIIVGTVITLSLCALTIAGAVTAMFYL